MSETAHLPTQLQSYVHISRYARWIEEKGRRETWEETVDRYCQFFKQHHPDTFPTDRVYDAIVNQHVMPSMRAFMTAGPALDRDHVAGYNCAFTSIDHVRAFDEILYILMCGTGVGFSVERQSIKKLPEISDDMHECDTVITVQDSKVGWATAFRTLIGMLYNGQIPTWDVSKVRPAGAKLKTFGGRASGPGPLVSLFKFSVAMFKKAAGRRLTSVECHDLVCKIADIVVVGGVRRSALISLSNLSDDRMRVAKSGQWWELDPQRALANNSAAYTEKPDMELFMEEWVSLVKSKSGERGIFNRVAAQKKAAENGRRDPEHAFGTNPSLRAGTLVLTTNGIRPIETLADGREFNVPVGNGETAKAICRLSSPDAELFALRLRSGRTHYATAEHKWPLLNGSKKVTADLRAGDRIPTGIRSLPSTGTPADEMRGYLVGYWLGNGWRTVRADGGIQIGIVVPMHRRNLLPRLTHALEEAGVRTSFPLRDNGTFELNTVSNSLNAALENAGVTDKNQGSFVKVWNNSGKFLRGLFDGLMASDGCIGADRESFSSKNPALRDLVADLAYFSGRKPALRSQTSDIQITKPSGQMYEYPNYTIYTARWGTTDSVRHDYDEVVSVVATGLREPVWDLTVAHDRHTFVIPGVVTGNCGEIILRPCGFCNLTEVVVRADDGLETLKEKVTAAVIMGTFQSTLTDFRYLRPTWKRNADEERLLGVSLTGIMDHPVLSCASKNVPQEVVRGTAIAWLIALKEHAIEVNKKYAEILGIPQSAAITTVKPSGTVSQLVDAASGIHPRYSRHYIRTVRASKMDPLAQFMAEAGFPVEDCALKGDTTAIFSFPVEAPAHAVMRNDMTALQQLEHYLIFKRHWCEHNPSITVYVRDHEWLAVGDWVYNHFDDIGGVSFLPHSDHTYVQAPYQECTKAQYDAMVSVMPNSDWSGLQRYEKEDTTVGTKTYACTGNSCELL